MQQHVECWFGTYWYVVGSIGIVGELDFDVIFSEHGMVTSNEEATDYPEQWATDVFVGELIVNEDVDWDLWREWVDAGRRWYR